MCYSQHKKRLIMLEEENHSFAADKCTEIKGNIKIETGSGKGTLHVNVQNLMHHRGGVYIYKLIFLGRRKEKTIFAVMGTIVPEPCGRGDEYVKFDPCDVDGKGHELKEFSTAIVAALSTVDKKEALHPVLRASMEAEMPKPKRNYNIYYNQHILQGCKRLENKIELYDPMQPFKEDTTKAVWRRVANVGRLPMITPQGRQAASKYRHFIFGMDAERYYIGIPGRYMEREQPEQGKSGFLLWQPIMGAEKLDAKSEDCPAENIEVAYGYWIAAVDKENGEIVDVE